VEAEFDQARVVQVNRDAITSAIARNGIAQTA